ncbi:uncharacterized protein LOC132313931 [Cornus florida]|uniref:uncharacterized protein LOC132313931 n=1 Tax=Cornus florida TaxID=4283 RepID=UPI00289C726D|nr:uncharacterized protein LOC132313931 [Cornus florida]
MWLRIHDLPMHYQNEASISKVCSSFAKPIYMDDPETHRDKGHFVRVMVEVDVQEVLPDYMIVDIHDIDCYIELEYEWKPIVFVDMPQRNPQVVSGVSTSNAFELLSSNNGTNEENTVEEEVVALNEKNTVEEEVVALKDTTNDSIVISSEINVAKDTGLLEFTEAESSSQEEVYIEKYLGETSNVPIIEDIGDMVVNIAELAVTMANTSTEDCQVMTDLCTPVSQVIKTVDSVEIFKNIS